jgi:hypothetical protein
VWGNDRRSFLKYLLTETWLSTKEEAAMAEPAPQRSMKRVWILALAVVIVVWIIYALTGGTSTPTTETAPDSAPAQQR